MGDGDGLVADLRTPVPGAEPCRSGRDLIRHARPRRVPGPAPHRFHRLGDDVIGAAKRTGTPAAGDAACAGATLPDS
jgi:hypothetical protein